MTWKAIRRSLRGRMWLMRMCPPGRDWQAWRKHLLPWLGDDEYYRKTLVIPFGVRALVIALWEHRDLEDCDCNPYVHDPRWARWKRIRTLHGRLEA